MGHDASDERQAAGVVEGLREVLGPAVTGMWLHGSWVRGGLRPGSDIDILVVLERPTTRAERDALVRGFLSLSGRPADGRSLEVTLVVRDAVRPWVYPPPLELQYGDWWRRALEAGEEPWPASSADLAVTLAAALEASEPLDGSPALHEVLGPAPAADLRRALIDALPALGADLEGDEANVLLTLARILVTLATGRIVPKDEAADWTLERLGPAARPALQWAAGVYRGTATDARADRAAVLACARDLLVAIAEAADRAG
jgi:streptomycin 3"-adenylyltransferase